MSKHEQTYLLAKEIYAGYGVNTDEAMEILDRIPISFHCWQGDDIIGFESDNTTVTGGIQATGNYPGRARTLAELMDDMKFAFSLIPGKNKANIHANYLDNGGKFVERTEIEPKNYQIWLDWAKDLGVGLDFNSTFFSHPLSENGTLTNPDENIRKFWIEHAKKVRVISEYFGKELGTPCVTNHWIPDGDKEIPMSTLAIRERLMDSLNQIFERPSDPKLNKDSVESKLFGIGSESYVPGSNEFYLGYCVQHPNILLTMDAGHYHPTEVISAKISSVLCYLPEILLHVSRPVRWDSDHVVLYDDETQQIMREIVRNDVLDRVNIATDYFDASINRITAWVLGARNTKKALLAALLEPKALLKAAEAAGDRTQVLALTQEALTLPIGAVWNYYCEKHNMPTGLGWMEEIKLYEQNVLSKRMEG